MRLEHFAEVMEQVRLNRVYNGLKVKDDRPRYINLGKDQDYYLRTRRKTRALFPPLMSGAKIPGLKTRFRPIMGGSPATYYIREDGTAASVGAATGPGTAQADCMDVAKHNADALNEIVPGDLINICDDGGLYRVTIAPPQDGADENHVVYQPEPGDSPIIFGSNERATWINEAGNLWYSAGGAWPDAVWFRNTDGSINWGDEELVKGNLNAEYEWWWDAGNTRLYCWAATDPDTRYTTVESSARTSCIDCDDVDYITLQGGIELAFSRNEGVTGRNAIALTVDGLTIHHIGEIEGALAEGVIITNAANQVVRNCTIYNAGNHGVFVNCNNAAAAQQDALVESNILRDCYHSGVDMQNQNTGTHDGCTIRYNYIYWTADRSLTLDPTASNGIYGEGAAGQEITGVNVYYNLIHEAPGMGIQMFDRITANIYNNTVWGEFTGFVGTAHGIAVSTANNTVTIINNIASEVQDSSLRVGALAGVAACNYNCWYNGAGSYALIVAVSYGAADFAAYQAATGFDANGYWEDPVFVDTSGLDFRLQVTSPCRNAGDDVGLTRDYAGNSVPRGSAPDIGCYEYLESQPGSAGFGDIRWPFRKRIDSGIRL